jgi:uncharacterized protein involved in type VI secretion and phage assembly
VSFLDLDRVQPATERASKLRGVHLAIVTENKDDVENGYRVKVRLPWLSADENTWWARIAVPMAGADRGTYVLPEKDDQVLVVFEHGDVSRPIIIGALWNEPGMAPEKNGNGKNDVKVIKSKHGHRIAIEDTDGAEKVTIVDKTKKNKLVLDASGNKVLIECEGDLEIKASAGTARFHGNAIKLTSKADFKGQANATLAVGASSAINVKASGQLTLKGGSATFNVPGAPLKPAMPALPGLGGMLQGAASALEQMTERGGGGGGGGGGTPPSTPPTTPPGTPPTTPP